MSLLYDSNREKELNRLYDCRFPGPLNNSWQSVYYFEKFAQEQLSRLDNILETLTEFEWFCCCHLASFNISHKMKILGFNFNWEGYEKDYF